MFERLIEWNKRRKLIRTARSIAESLVILGGPDLRGLSDDELIERLEEWHRAVAKTMKAVGVTAQEAADAFRRLGDAARKP